MSTADEAINIGPFTGGLADYNAQGEPTELAVCENLELDLNGNLVTRPMIYRDTSISEIDQPYGQIVASTILGFASHVITSGTEVEQFIFVVMPHSGAGIGTYWNLTNTMFTSPWTLVTPDVMGSVVQLDDETVIFLPENNLAAAGLGKGGTFNLNSKTFTNDGNIPGGLSAVIYKSRLWVCEGSDTLQDSPMGDRSRVIFSEPITSTTLSWPATNFIDVHPEDPDLLVDMMVYNDALVLFKENSTWVLAYDADPADGILQTINTDIGASRTDCIALHNDTAYTLHRDELYEIVNYNFEKINNKLDFDKGTFEPESGVINSERTYNQKSLSVIGDRILVRYGANYYAFDTLTRTWSRWTKIDHHTARQYKKVVLDPTISDEVTYIAGSTYLGTEPLRPREIYTINRNDEVYTEDIDFDMQTMDMDFGDKLHYKKMKWWGAEIASEPGNTINPEVHIETPYIASELPAGRGYPTITVPADTSSPINMKEYKRKGGFRFRSCAFEISGTAIGGSGKIVLGSITAVVNRKQTLSKDET